MATDPFLIEHALIIRLVLVLCRGACPGNCLHSNEKATSQQDLWDQPVCSRGDRRDDETGAVSSRRRDYCFAGDSPLRPGSGLAKESDVEEILCEAHGENLAQADEGPEAWNLAVLSWTISA